MWQTVCLRFQTVFTVWYLLRGEIVWTAKWCNYEENCINRMSSKVINSTCFFFHIKAIGLGVKMSEKWTDEVFIFNALLIFEDISCKQPWGESGCWDVKLMLLSMLFSLQHVREDTITQLGRKNKPYFSCRYIYLDCLTQGFFCFILPRLKLASCSVWMHSKVQCLYLESRLTPHWVQDSREWGVTLITPL